MRSDKLYVLKVLALVIAFNTGCVSMQQMQNGMDEIDSFWGGVNQKILLTNGSRIYPKETWQCLDAARKTAIQLGFMVTEEGSDYLLLQAKTPNPFTKEEFQQIKSIEEPIMQAIAANHVGKFISNFYYLDDSGKFFVTVRVNISQEQTANKTLVRVFFRIAPRKEIKGIIYGSNPPPEALRKGLEKWWGTFEKNLQHSPI